MTTQSERMSGIDDPKGASREEPAGGRREAEGSTTDRVAKAAHHAIDETAAKAEQVEKQVRERADRASAKVDRSQAAAREQIEESLDKVETFIREQPMTAAGIAFAAGIIVSTILRR